MQKKLIALALASAFAAPAFAATSNVDIYGVLNLSVNRVDSGISGKDNSTSIVSNASRLGFKGTEDLGGGLAAVWQVESLINPDSQTGSFVSRNSFVGLKGGFGTVVLGNMDTPMKALGRAVDNFPDTMADSRNLLGATYVGGKSAFDLRTKNTIAYVTPSFSGLSATLGYVADHGLGATPTSCVSGLDCNKNDAWSASANYNNGPLMLGAGYERHNAATGLTTTASRHMWRAVGGYSFGDAKLGALYESGSSDTTLTPEADRKAWGLFGNYGIGAVTLKANYLKVDTAKNTSNTGAHQWTVGADYALSKRSTLYALYAKVKNDTGAAFGLGGNSSASNTTLGNVGVDPSVFSVGLKHVF